MASKDRNGSPAARLTALAVLLAAVAGFFLGLRLGSRPVTLELTYVSDIPTTGRLYFSLHGDDYSEERTEAFPMHTGRGVASVRLPGWEQDRVRVDLGQVAGVYEVAGIRLTRGGGGFTLEGDALAASLRGHGENVSVERAGEALRATGQPTPPTLIFSLPPGTTGPGPLEKRLPAAGAAALLCAAAVWAALRFRRPLARALKGLLVSTNPWPAALILFGGYWVWLSPQPTPPAFWCCDAEHYWLLADSFIKDGSFSFLNYSNPLRCYAWPLMLLGVKKAAGVLGVDGLRLCQLCMGAMSVFAVCWLYPFFSRRFFGVSPAFWQNLALGGVWFLFWRGYVVFPMADAPAFILVMSALALLMLECRGMARRLACSLGAGVLFGLAMYARLPFLASAPFFLVAAALSSSGGWGRRALVAAVVALGVAAAMVPQLAINITNHKMVTPFDTTAKSFGGQSLYFVQVVNGVAITRHESGIFFNLKGEELLDSIGLGVLQDAGGNVAFRWQTKGGYADVLGLVLRHPLAYADILLRHLFSGLVPINPTLYQVAPQGLHRWLSLGVNLALLFAALSLLIAKAGVWARKPLALAALACLTVPSLVALPGAVEARYFMPVSMTLCALAVYGAAGFLRLWSGRRALGMALALALFASASVWLYVDIGQMHYSLSHVENGSLIMTRTPMNW